MSDLDTKLRELLDNAACIDCPGGDDRDDSLAQIKQAFQEAGYRQGFATKTYDKALKTANGWMTGQEWYDRFKAEYGYLIVGKCYPVDDGGQTISDDVDKAAKRAAGLTESRPPDPAKNDRAAAKSLGQLPNAPTTLRGKGIGF